MSHSSTLWIIHRESAARAALARMAGAGRAEATEREYVLGAPGDTAFDRAPAPSVVVLGVGADFEAELAFAERVTQRVFGGWGGAGACWFLFAAPGDLDEATRLFDTLPAEILAWPHAGPGLREKVSAALARRGVTSLSDRRGRTRVAARFSRWLAADDLPDVDRVLDPAVSTEPLLVRGEPGTGRGLLVRFAHQVDAPGAPGPLVRIACRGASEPQHLLAQLSTGAASSDAHTAIWLEEIDLLPTGLQRLVLDWLEQGPPQSLLRTRVSWSATAGDDAIPLAFREPGRDLDPELVLAFALRTARIPPLRERRASIEHFVTEAARTYANARGEPPRRFGEDALLVLRDEPWPGNTRELEAVVLRTLARTGASSDPISADDLCFEDTGPGLPPVLAIDPLPSPSDHLQLATEQDLGEDELVAITELLTEEPAPATAGDSEPSDSAAWRRLAAAVAHEVRNPLTSIRTLSAMLGDHYMDGEFRERFRDVVGGDVRRIENAVHQLENAADASAARTATVDVTALLDGLLDAESDRIQLRRLLVLKELDRSHPDALVDGASLRDALAGVIGRAIATVPERSDLYLASKHHAQGRGSGPSIRVLLRYSTSAGEVSASNDGGAPTLRGHEIEHASAETTINALGGTFTVDNTDANETVIVIDLPAPQS